MRLAPAVELTTFTAPGYLEGRGLTPVRVTELAGGVSNTVLLIETPMERLVLKQSLPQLRVDQQWLSDRSRIWREADALEAVAPYFPPGALPTVIFRDDDNYLFAMSAAAPESESWKSLLLRCECDRSTAERVGLLSAGLIRAGWQSRVMQSVFGDLTVFDQLRLDPYYRSVSARHPDLTGFFGPLVDSYPSRCCTLVHGDWSPKNFLVAGEAVMAIDFEAIHFGDPAFDAAFLLNHLLLKSFHLPGCAAAFADLAEGFWTVVTGEIPPIPDFERRTIEHLGALLLSRIDGKSPAEYIRDPDLKQRIRQFARDLILNPPISVLAVFDR